MTGVIIDIGSGSIGLATVLLEKGRVPTLIYSSRKDFKVERNLNPRILLTNTVEILRSSIAEMQKKGVDNPSDIFCFLSPHLVASETRTINIKFDKTTKISEAMINDLVEKELGQSGSIAMRVVGDNSQIMFEKKIMGVRLNGYETASVNNKFANTVEIAVFSTISSKNILDSIKNVVINSFHHTQVEFHSFPFAYFNALRDIFKSEQDFVFMDIGSEITDISLVKDGVFIKSTTFPHGKNRLLRQLVDKTKKDESIVKSMLANYIENAIVERQKTDFSLILSSVGAEWAETVKSILNEMSNETKLPGNLFILVDNDVEDIFRGFISSMHISEITVLNKEPEWKFLTSVELNKFCENRSGEQNDPFLIISAIFVNKLLN